MFPPRAVKRAFADNDDCVNPCPRRKDRAGCADRVIVNNQMRVTVVMNEVMLVGRPGDKFSSHHLPCVARSGVVNCG